ncbi:hypothetical protein AM1_D0010 (plasmid) [Acaryochloris marina MBIC11017]|uniref:Uncharacterized protein n=1 Tax=Acaryochloris marina (strain MBIC 11017) TaxID=329726 RepID=A8ZNC1_ACAM1|nr:hypothetical protein AM1_D0010 [Acaryochloris marina MBIC11017]
MGAGSGVLGLKGLSYLVLSCLVGLSILLFQGKKPQFSVILNERWRCI